MYMITRGISLNVAELCGNGFQTKMNSLNSSAHLSRKGSKKDSFELFFYTLILVVLLRWSFRVFQDLFLAVI